MRGWNRLCASVECNEKCPLYAEVDCTGIPTKEEAEIIEREVRKWEAEHPVKVYPTWYRWISDINGGAVVDHAFLLQPIPADIAEKLGVKPLK